MIQRIRISEMNILGQLHVEDYEPKIVAERIRSIEGAGFKRVDRNQTLYPMTFNSWEISKEGK